MQTANTLATSVHDNLRHHSRYKVLIQAERKPERRPVMSILQNLQRIALEVHGALKVHLVEGFHRDLALSVVLGAVMLAVKVQVVLDWFTGVLCLFVLARRDGRGDGPVDHQDGDGREEGE